MTRAEAIKILINYGENNIIARTKVGIAFDMAIKSLETDEAYQLEYERTTKENLADAEDCINRDSAIKALGYDIKCFEFKSGVSKHMDDIANLLNTIYEIQVNNIKALPSVTPQEPRWIPVSERLPKAGEYVGDVEKYYLVQNEYGDMLVARYTHSEYWEQVYQLKPIGDEIVAWMPLPIPYESQESEG